MVPLVLCSKDHQQQQQQHAATRLQMSTQLLILCRRLLFMRQALTPTRWQVEVGSTVLLAPVDRLLAQSTLSRRRDCCRGKHMLVERTAGAESAAAGG